MILWQTGIPEPGASVTAARLEVAAISLAVLTCGQTILHVSFCPAHHDRARQQLTKSDMTVESNTPDPAVIAGLTALAAGRPPTAPLSCATYFLDRGTAFQRRVWQALADIPAGTVRTYGDLARSLGDLRLARAVGNACHRNPLALVLPCHRVVAAGGLGGFAGPDATKRLLLERERDGGKSLTG